MEGPFESEAEALASLEIQPGEPWGGTVWEEQDDFDSHADAWGQAAARSGKDQFAAGVAALERADKAPFLSPDYMHYARVAADHFKAAAASLAGVDDELAAKATEAVQGLELFLAQPWPDDPSDVETRDFVPDDEDEPSAPRGHQSRYPSGITSTVHWEWKDDTFRVMGEDTKPGAAQYEYAATVRGEALVKLAEALATDVDGIPEAWAAQIETINTPGFVTWLRNHDVEFQFWNWHDGDWFGTAERTPTERDRVEFVRRRLGPGATDEEVALARQGQWDDPSIDLGLLHGG